MARNILILEDNKSHMAALEKMIQHLNQHVNYYCAYTVKEAVQIAFEHRIHLFIIDIILNTTEPGDVSGLNFMKEMREVTKYKHTPLIFITSLEDPKYFSYSQLHCFRFIEKPFNVHWVKKTILEALEVPVVEEEDRYVFFQRDRIAYSVYIKEIICIELVRRKIRIYLKNGVREFGYITYEEIMRKLDSASFIRSSRNYIINKRYIEYVDSRNRFVKLKHMKNPIEIGPIMKKSFLDRIKNE